MRYIRLFIFILSLALLLHGCTTETRVIQISPKERSPHSSGSMILVTEPFSTIISQDDLSKESLFNSIEQSLSYLRIISPDSKFNYGNVIYTAEEVIFSLNLFKYLLRSYQSDQQFINKLEDYFFLFESVSNENNGVLFTGYYEPIFKGNLKQTKEFNIPVYGRPDDLMILRLGNFRRSLKERTIIARLEKNNVVPYYTRKEIMHEKVLRGRKLEIAWMKDPLDLFFLQIQGSGILELPDGSRVKLSYNGANGRNYSSIGKLLLENGKMALKEISMDGIRRYLVNHPEERDQTLYHNASYTFLKLEDKTEAPRGNINVPLTPSRSIASDAFIFPKAALGFIKTEVPIFDAEWKIVEMKPISRFVVNQDTGGAIRGPGRVDLFWGNGKRAEKSAGMMRSFGKVYFLIAKKNVLAEIVRMNVK